MVPTRSLYVFTHQGDQAAKQAAKTRGKRTKMVNINITGSVEGSERIIHTDLSADFLIGDLRAYLADEAGFATDELIILFEGKELDDDSATLQSSGFKQDEFVILRRKVDRQLPAAVGGGGGFGAGVGGGGFGNNQAYQELMRLQQDPDNPDNQRRILELIQQQRIDENLQNALEVSPESFTSVPMLYVNVEVNGVAIRAFVDSGAQSTIMNEQLAKRCDLTDLIDKRFQGKAIGVGEQAILGKIHSAPLKIDGQYVPCSFTVINTSIDLLIGLDMLRRHQAIIDLKQNKLIIGDDIKAEFLHESEIPKTIFNDPEAAAKAAQAAAGQILQPNTSSSTNLNPPQTAAQHAAQAAQQRSQGQKFDEASIQNLMNLGFARQQVIQALESTQGNTELAAALLFQSF